jgi:predicted nucleotidyltransferase
MLDIRYRDRMDFLHPVEAVIPGTQGRVLAVLAETTAELNLRTVARLASVSPAQASRVLPGMVELGLVERREVPPSSLFRLSRQHVAARLVIELSRSHEIALEQMGAAALELALPPASVVIFGSFARRQADRHSDIDALIVRPDGIDEDDDTWTAGVEQWRQSVRTITGNPVEVVETDRSEASEKLSSKRSLWRDIVRDGVVVNGANLDELRGARV